ncbi:hypothetical protein QA599_19390 [Haloarculaceae archaeon H-GB1-1]|nr:hypothetical protein [Haloarculaceae archaeon H-GB1-1]
MSAIPAAVDTDSQPPMAIPLAHFAVALGFLVAGGGVAVAEVLDVAPGWATLAHVHLLLAGWICLTIMGAMTQFVPVWSGVSLYSMRLAKAQLALATVGLAGFAWALLASAPMWIHGFGALLLAGFWTLAYNVGRTLWRARPLDVTERHFALALGFFVVLTAFGFVLAMDLALPVLPRWGVTHPELLGAHATLAVYGAVLTTVVGALYQLATMFTQSDLRGIDYPLQRFETVAYPLGVVLLATGRLLSHVLVARVGAALVLASLFGFGIVVLRRLVETKADWNAMLTRYAVAAVALPLWVLVSAPSWLARPLSLTTLFGPPGSVHLLLVGVVGMVVAGTLYHVVPFIVWVERYSDRLGLEVVPMIDDLYDDRLATADFAAFVVGTALLVARESLGATALVGTAGTAFLFVGLLAFAANLALVLHRHVGWSITDVVAGPPPDA